MEENTQQKICPNCGEHLTPEQDVCPVCGLGYAAYMEVKSNPKAELAKLYELIESYDGWSTPEEKKERRRKERRREKEERKEKREEILDGIMIAAIAIMLISVIGLIPEASFWIKIVGWFIIGIVGFCVISSIVIFICFGIDEVLDGSVKDSIEYNKSRKKEILFLKQKIKEIEATGVTYNYQRPKPQEEAKPLKSVSKKEKPITGEYKGEVRFEGKNNKRKKEIERKIHFVLSIILPILYLLFTAFILKKMDSNLGVFTNSLTGEVELFGWFYMCWEDISVLLILISMVINIGVMIWSYIGVFFTKTDIVFKKLFPLKIIFAVISFLILGMVYGGGSVYEEAFIRWYWIYIVLENIILVLTMD